VGSETELVLFRVLQESLTNVHRHSGSKTATVKIGADGQRVWLEVQDNGKSQEALNTVQRSEALPAGVGITGMRERVRNLGGVLQTDSDPSGTRVRAVLPIIDNQHRDKLNRN
jgi:two-component system, NarL family, sensor kinase